MLIALFMGSLLIEDLSLIRNGDLNLMRVYNSPSEFWSEFGGLHRSLKIVDLTFEEIEAVKS